MKTQSMQNAKPCPEKALLDLLNYDPDTGIFSSEKCDVRTGYRKQGQDYLVIYWAGTVHTAHRLVFHKLGYNIDGLIIHHCNEDQTDNRLVNLSPMTLSNHMAMHQGNYDASERKMFESEFFIRELGPPPPGVLPGNATIDIDPFSLGYFSVFTRLKILVRQGQIANPNTVKGSALAAIPGRYRELAKASPKYKPAGSTGSKAELAFLKQINLTREL